MHRLRQPGGMRLQGRQRRQLAVAAAGGFGKPKEKALSKQKACPCGSGQAFKECCQRYHDGELPETPEKLMRSRYSAYVKGVCHAWPITSAQIASHVLPVPIAERGQSEPLPGMCAHLTWAPPLQPCCRRGSSSPKAAL